MNMKKHRQEIDALRGQIEPHGAGANLVSDRFVVIRRGPEDDAAVADMENRARAADEKAVVIWIVDPPAKQQVTA